MLSSKGADVSAQGTLGVTPLHLAALLGLYEVGFLEVWFFICTSMYVFKYLLGNIKHYTPVEPRGVTKLFTPRGVSLFGLVVSNSYWPIGVTFLKGILIVLYDKIL